MSEHETDTGPVAAPAAPTTRAYDVEPKRPFFAAFLSLMPGMGNIYNGLYLRGVITFLIIIGLIAITARGNPLLGFAIAFFWIFNAIDAYRQATLINYGYAQDLGLTDMPKEISPGQGGVIGGAILILIGLIAALEEYAAFDLDWMVDLWPFALIAIGAWVVWASLRDRKKKRGAEAEYGS